MSGDLPEDEHQFRQWLEGNPVEALKNVGLTDGLTVLDYGCGGGTFAIPAARLVNPNGEVYALDIDAKALRTLRRKAQSAALENIEIILAKKSAPLAALSPRSVDVILLYDVLQLVDDKRSLLRELHKVLKPDGVLSVFPMHIGTQRMLELAEEDGLFTLRDRCGMILDFGLSGAPGT